MKNVFSAIFSAMFLAIVVWGSAYSEKPLDGPIITSGVGQITARGNVRVMDGSLLYGWTEHEATFKEDNGKEFRFNLDERNGEIYEGLRCQVKLQEVWQFKFKGCEYRRQVKIVAFERIP